MADKQISDLTSASALTDGSLFVLEQAGEAMKANWGMMKDYISPGVAAQYSTSATYDVGDYVIYNGQLYRCTTAITTAESWTAAHWTAAVLGDDVNDLKSALSFSTKYDDYEYTKDKSVSHNTPITMATEEQWECIIIECNPGDVFRVKGYGGNSTRLWMFSDESGTLLSESAAALHTQEYVEIVAPVKAKYLSCNSQYTQYPGSVMSTIKNDIQELDTKTDDINGNVVNALAEANGAYNKVTKDQEISDGSSASESIIDYIGGDKLTDLGILVTGSQSGSGTPSPSNVRSFNNIPSSFTLTITDRNDTEIQKTISIPSNAQGVVYEGIVYPTIGLFKIIKKRIKLDGVKYKAISVVSARNLALIAIKEIFNSSAGTGMLCDKLEPIPASATWNNYSQFVSYETTDWNIVVKPPVSISTVDDANSWLKANSPEIVLPLAKPEYLEISTYEINSSFGYNEIETSSGIVKEIPKSGRIIANLKNSNAFDYLLDKELCSIGINESTSNNGVTFKRNRDDSFTFTTEGATGETVFNLTRKKVKANQIIDFTISKPLNGYFILVYVNNVSNTTLYSYKYFRSGVMQIPNNSDVDNVLIRIVIPTGAVVDETVEVHAYSVPETDVKELKVLVFGNSFSYSTLSYVPTLMNELYPEISLTFGILYSSGMQFTGQISNFTNDTKYELYSKFKNGKWINQSNAVTGKNALDEEHWDFVVLQQSAEHMDDFANLEVFADLISKYLTYPVQYVYNIPQARGADDDTWLPDHYSDSTMKEKSNHHFQDIANYAERAMSGPIISNVLPSGTAVQNARTTTLSQYGNHGNLCVDQLSHLQNGIGILTAGYAACYALLQVYGVSPKLYGTQFEPTDDWKSDVNLPISSHGSCVGITDENRLLGMKCAMMAIKKPFELTDCSSI